MKVTLNALLVSSLVALNATAQQAAPNPSIIRPSQAMPPGLTKTPGPREPAPEMPDKETLSYFVGMTVGNSIKKQELTNDIDVDTIAIAIKDILAGRPTRFNDVQYQALGRQLNGALRAKMTAKRAEDQAKLEKEGAENKAKGDAFLANNAHQPGIQAFTNGIQYKVITDGSGVLPGPHDSVNVAYKGSLIDGTVFDQNDKFTTLVTGRTIKGWSEVLQQMKVGSKWQVFIPPDLAYGLHPSSAKIPPNAVLIFDMELLSDTPPTPPNGAQAMAKPTMLTPAGTAPVSTPGGPPSPVVSGQIIKVPSAEDLKRGAKIEVITNELPVSGSK